MPLSGHLPNRRKSVEIIKLSNITVSVDAKEAAEGIATVIPGPFKRHIKYRNEISSTAYSSEATEHAAEGTGTWSID
ncbi:hypothetical protein RB195_015139 [Necator americanus]|uniref:Uncharacterized protein n=1 Tax=Necator americanus TaxID=51031 RepID=A0ABR1E5U6_NECAM